MNNLFSEQERTGFGKIFDSVPEALDDLRCGRMVVVVDDDDRENEGDIICAAQFMTPQAVNFMTIHARGLLCLAMEAPRLLDLDIRQMVMENSDPHETAFTVSVDAKKHLLRSCTSLQ